MSRRFWCGLAAVTGSLLFGFVPWALSQTTGRNTAPPRTVRVEHQLVRIDHQTAEGRPAPGKFVPERIRPRHQAARRAARGKRPEGLAAQAKRIFFGDGRYRPHPFPGGGF